MNNKEDNSGEDSERLPYLHASPEFKWVLLSKYRLNNLSYVSFYASIIGYLLSLVCALLFLVFILPAMIGEPHPAGSTGGYMVGLGLMFAAVILFFCLILIVIPFLIALALGFAGLIKPNPSMGRAVVVAIMPFLIPLAGVNLVFAFLLRKRFRQPTKREKQAAGALGIEVPQPRSQILDKLNRKRRRKGIRGLIRKIVGLFDWSDF